MSTTQKNRATGRTTLTLSTVALSAGFALAAPSFAQQASPDPNELDPNAPMDAMPDLGVEWPDMNAADPVPLPDPEPVPGEVPDLAEEVAGTAGVSIDDSVAARRYANLFRT